MSKSYGYDGLPLKDDPLCSGDVIRVDADGNVFVSGWNELVKKVDRLVEIVEALDRASRGDKG